MARMKPIGLTYKSDGELMVVHQCLYCSRISRNRIAGDDNPYVILDLLCNDPQTAGFKNIKLLTLENKSEVHRVLFGN